MTSNITVIRGIFTKLQLAMNLTKKKLTNHETKRHTFIEREKKCKQHVV